MYFFNPFSFVLSKRASLINQKVLAQIREISLRGQQLADDFHVRLDQAEIFTEKMSDVLYFFDNTDNNLYLCSDRVMDVLRDFELPGFRSSRYLFEYRGREYEYNLLLFSNDFVKYVDFSK